MVFATLKNHKWVENQRAAVETDQVTDQVADQVEKIMQQQRRLLEFCSVPRTRKEMQEFIGISSRVHFKNNYLGPLLTEGKIRMTIPDKPNSSKQRYVRA